MKNLSNEPTVLKNLGNLILASTVSPYGSWSPATPSGKAPGKIGSPEPLINPREPDSPGFSAWYITACNAEPVLKLRRFFFFRVCFRFVFNSYVSLSEYVLK